MKKNKFVLPILLCIAPSLSLAQYRPDWNYKNFYEEINACRVEVVISAGNQYEKRGSADHLPEEQLRNELIAITPVTEASASAVCYCIFNEVAKDIDYASYKSDPSKISGYVQGNKCKGVMAQTMKSINKERANSLRLK